MIDVKHLCHIELSCTTSPFNNMIEREISSVQMGKKSIKFDLKNLVSIWKQMEVRFYWTLKFDSALSFKLKHTANSLSTIMKWIFLRSLSFFLFIYIDIYICTTTVYVKRMFFVLSCMTLFSNGSISSVSEKISEEFSLNWFSNLPNLNQINSSD